MILDKWTVYSSFFICVYINCNNWYNYNRRLIVCL
jgi:hypothetical protein